MCCGWDSRAPLKNDLSTSSPRPSPPFHGGEGVKSQGVKMRAPHTSLELF
jgi:hypothetical protein